MDLHEFQELTLRSDASASAMSGCAFSVNCTRRTYATGGLHVQQHSVAAVDQRQG